jgi:hypothetical protein
MEKMSKQRGQELVKAAECVIGLVKSGQTPIDAMVKVAGESELTPAEMLRVAEAYNTSRTLYHLKSRNGEEKLASFPIVRTGEVLARLFPDHYSSPAETARSSIYKQASTGPHRIFDLMSKQASQAVMEKAASEAEEPAPAADPARELESAYRLARRTQMEKDAAEVDLLKAQTDLEKAMDYASYQIQFHHNAGDTPFERLEAAIHQRYGDEGEKLAELLMGVSGLQNQRNFVRRSLEGPVRVSYTGEPFRSVDNLYQQVEKLAGMVDGYQKVAAVAEQAAEVYEQLRHPQEKQAIFDATTGAFKSFFQGLEGLSAKPQYEAELRKSLDKVTDPDHRDALTRIRIRSMLTDLLSNDEVIKTYDAQEVLDRYNELSQAAPHLADQPLLVRSALRRALQSGTVDPFEGGQYVNMDKTLADNRSGDASRAAVLAQDPVASRANVNTGPGPQTLFGSPILGTTLGTPQPGKDKK